MFGGLFRIKNIPKIGHASPGEVFAWPAGTTLRPLNPVVLGLPIALLGENEPIGSVIRCDDDAEIAVIEEEKRILLRLQPGMCATLTKSCEVCIVPDGDEQPRQIEIISR